MPWLCPHFAPTLPPVIPITCLSRLFLCFIESWCVTSWQFYNRLQSTLHRPKQLLSPRFFSSSRRPDLLCCPRSQTKPWRPSRGMKVQLYSFFILGAAPRPARFMRGTLCTGGWVDPRTVLDGCKKSSPTGIRFPDRPSCAVTLYWLSYPGPTRSLLFNGNRITFLRVKRPGREVTSI
jgi:hypothetical protein